MEVSGLGESKLLLSSGLLQNGTIFKLSAEDILGNILSASDVDMPGKVIARSASGVDGGLPALE